MKYLLILPLIPTVLALGTQVVLGLVAVKIVFGPSSRETRWFGRKRKQLTEAHSFKGEYY